MKGILKWPLLVAAAVVIVRVIIERGGASDAVGDIFSVAVLHTLVVPIYFAIRIARDGVRSPYATLFKLVAVYAVLTRAMIIPVYWLARVYEWPQRRFGGLWGPDVPPFEGLIGVPFGTAAVWIVASICVGGALGSLIIAIMRRK